MNYSHADAATDTMPHHTVETQTKDAEEIMVDLMPKVDVLALDLDKVWLKGGKIPMTPEGHLDIDKLNQQSPLTIPIIHELNELALRGVSWMTITGKSGTEVLLEDLERKMLMEQASEKGMLQKPYVAQPNSSGIAFSSEIAIKPEFLEPKTGRMRAIDEHGKPTDRLVLLFSARDNGGSRDEYWPDGSHEVDKFPRAFYETFLRPDIQKLLEDSSRQSKLNRMQTIKLVLYNMPEADTSDLTPEKISSLSDDQLWEAAVVSSIDFSYPSPNHGAKFNLELAMKKILGDDNLKNRWTSVLQSLTHNNTEEVTDEDSIRRTLELLFPKSVANVTLNFVHEEGGMGQRVVIDLNPPGVNKLQGFLKMVKNMEALYKQAGLPIPKFVSRSIRMGDGPDKNDKEMLEQVGGWTNTSNPHEKHNGFPVDSIPMLEKFGIQVKSGEVLEDTEHTYLFIRLIQLRKLGKLLNGIPEDLRKKIIIPQQLQSL